MKRRDLAELLALAAIWGGSFLFMRVGAPAFGALPLAGLRVIGATLVLLPLLALHSGDAGFAPLRTHWKPLLVVGIVNSAFPFACFAYATLTITAGLGAIFNAAAPLFGAAIAWVWLRDRPTPLRSLGIAIGFLGVFGLAYSRAALKDGAEPMRAALAVLACIAATVSYGHGANYTKRYLTGVPPLAVAAGSQVAAALVLLVPTVVWWPSAPPSALAWLNVALLAGVCTGFAYVLFFRLIANVGPANAITVTFLIPAFGIAWGVLFLGETVTPTILIGCAVILVGTALATGLLPRPRPPQSAIGKPT